MAKAERVSRVHEGESSWFRPLSAWRDTKPMVLPSQLMRSSHCSICRRRQNRTDKSALTVGGFFIRICSHPQTYRPRYLYRPRYRRPKKVLSPIFTALTHGGMARLSWRGWLVTHQEDHPSQHQPCSSNTSLRISMPAGYRGYGMTRNIM